MSKVTKAPMPSQLSDYEMRRLRNIEDNKRVLALLNQDLKNFGINLSGEKLFAETKKPAAKKPEKRKREEKRTSMSQLLLARNYSPPRTRARRSNSLNSSAATSPDRNCDDGDGKPKLVVKFGFAGKKSSFIDDDDEPGLPKRRYSGASQLIDHRSADEITDEDLGMVADVFGDKVYDSFRGSSCHQCRQKTLDQKTICRSGECYGVRGQFCGPCLRIRYGEDVREALKNGTWACPACRGICNCSFCRKKAGSRCTGILIHLARDKGFKDVNSYLQSLHRISSYHETGESHNTKAMEKRNESDSDSDSDSEDELDAKNEKSKDEEKTAESTNTKAMEKRDESESDSESEDELNAKNEESEDEGKTAECFEEAITVKEEPIEFGENESEVANFDNITVKQEPLDVEPEKNEPDVTVTVETVDVPDEIVNGVIGNETETVVEKQVNETRESFEETQPEESNVRVKLEPKPIDETYANNNDMIDPPCKMDSVSANSSKRPASVSEHEPRAKKRRVEYSKDDLYYKMMMYKLQMSRKK